jgi:hypothetical protein
MLNCDSRYTGWITPQATPKPITSQNGMSEVNLLLDTRTGTLVECEKTPSLQDFLKASSNYQG